MIQYREIIRQLGLGLSQAQIATSCGCARNTVRTITAALKERVLSFASLATSSDAELEALLFPEKRTQPFNRRMPDFEQASNELAQNGVTLKLLWAEYCEDCRQANQQPFMYSQFFCSQFEPTGWSGKFPEATIADAILDRIVHDSYSIEIKAADQEHQASMREIYGLDGQIAK